MNGLLNCIESVVSHIFAIIHNWKTNGWKTAAKKSVKNKELWVELDELIQIHQINWIWVKGHSGHPQNEKADELANIANHNFV